MPRFYFHLRTDGCVADDELGSEFPNLEAAYLEAFEAARAIWAEKLLSREDPTRCAFLIASSPDGEPLLEMPFSEVLEASKGRVLRKPASPLFARARDSAEAMMERVRALEAEIATARERVSEARELNARLARLVRLCATSHPPDHSAGGASV